ncbi:hypothetical protein BDN67DRAFT_824739 [Paxillus ammoniavirescens]|nr:hypothetical protein BDN67DRAFT_824739 [Paxillus ammoniavirescens]
MNWRFYFELPDPYDGDPQRPLCHRGTGIPSGGSGPPFPIDKFSVGNDSVLAHDERIVSDLVDEDEEQSSRPKTIFRRRSLHYPPDPDAITAVKSATSRALLLREFQRKEGINEQLRIVVWWRAFHCAHQDEW